MKLLTIFAVLIFGVANAQHIFYDCDSLGQYLNNNFTWTCRRRSCSGDFRQARMPYKEYPCDTNDVKRMCCPEIAFGWQDGLNGAEDGKNEANIPSPNKQSASSAESKTPSGKQEKTQPSVTPPKVPISTTHKSNNASNVESDALIAQLQSKRFQKFGLDLLLELGRANHDKNVIVSQASVTSLLALLLEGSSAESAGELFRVLQLKPGDEVTSLTLLRKLVQVVFNNKHSPLTLESQSRMYKVAGLQVKLEYENLIQSVYNTDIVSANFSKPNLVADLMNKWMKEVTNGLVSKGIEKENINTTTKLFLLNAMYLKVGWDIEFNPAYTRKRCFYNVKNECRPLKFMYKKRTLNYTNSPAHKAEIFEIPLEDPRYTIVFMLPHRGVDVYESLKSLNRVDLLALLSSLEKEASIDLLVPRTTIEFSSDLVQILQGLGVKSVFGNAAKLDKMLKNKIGLNKIQLVHKATLEINEAGKETVEDAGVETELLSQDSKKIIVLDRPFLVFVRDTLVAEFLLQGVVASLESN